MASLALGLVLGGAFVHAFWNLLVKQSRNPGAFLYFSTIVSLVVSAPFVILTTPLDIVPALIPILVVSGIAENLYLIALSRAYESGDLSLVYPLARGSAPFFVTLFSAIFLGERLPPFGLLGVALLGCGIYLTTLPSLREWLRPIRSLEKVSSRWALLSGFFISVYTLADRQGVRLISPVTYNLYLFALMAIGFTPYLLLTGRLKSARSEIKIHGVGMFGTGVVNIINYLVILWAFTIVPASYVSAVRGSSIIMGAYYGWRVRGEPLGSARIVAVFLIVAGIVSLAVGG